jgi:hypothetical protein
MGGARSGTRAAAEDLRTVRQPMQAFLPRYEGRYEGSPRKKMHVVWLGRQQFAHPAQQIAFQGYLLDPPPRLFSCGSSGVQNSLWKCQCERKAMKRVVSSRR